MLFELYRTSVVTSHNIVFDKRWSRLTEKTFTLAIQLTRPDQPRACMVVKYECDEADIIFIWQCFSICPWPQLLCESEFVVWAHKVL